MSGMSRTARMALLASLALNIVLVVALLIAAPWSHAHREGSRAAGTPVSFRIDRSSCPARSACTGTQATLDEALQSHREAMRARLGALFDARRDVRAAIVADRSTAPCSCRIRAAAQRRNRHRKRSPGAARDVLVQTTAAERQRLAELSRVGRRHRDGERKPDRDAPTQR